jgi:curli biogenesis system outer membrane secretion channel CsgG
MSRTEKMNWMRLLTLVALFAGGLVVLPAATAGEAIPATPAEPRVITATPEQPKPAATPAQPAAEKVIIAQPLKEETGAAPAETTTGAVIVGVPVEGTPIATAIPALPPLKGPKKSLAVTDFENTSSFTGEWNLGSGIADMLTTALIQADRFIVVERPKIRSILREQSLLPSGGTFPGAGAKTGSLIPAQIGVSGTVTDFSFEKEKTGTAAEQQNVGAGLVTGVARVAINLRILDTATGQVLFSDSVERKGTYTGAEADYTTKSLAIGGENFPKTPLGKATQETIDDAAYRIALNMDKVPWRGSIVLIQTDKVYINCGQREGIQPGQKFVVYSKGEELTDPDTGELLGVEETKAGRVSVVEVNEKYSIAQIEAGGNFKRGDVLRLY